MNKKYRVLWSSKVLIFWVIVAILLFFTNTSTHAINFLPVNYVGFFHEIPNTYLAGPGRYYLGPVPPNGIISPQVLYIEGEPRGYTGGSGGYYPGSIYSHYYNREGVYNPEPYPFLPMQVLYYEDKPIGYSSGTGFYYPGSFYSEVYNF